MFGRTTRSYLVCATPRSGSTLLCAALDATGVAGHPDEYFEALAATGRRRQPREYFAGLDDAEVLALLGEGDGGGPDPSRWDDDGFARHLAEVRERGTTPNGVFGAKLMWGYADDVRRLAGGDDLHATLTATFEDPAYVWVRRRDAIRQAVSLWRAIQSWSWRSDDPGANNRRPRFCRPALDHLIAQLREQDAAWERFFADHGVEPLTLTYEDDLEREIGPAIARVLDFLGLDSEAAPTTAPMIRQADAVSEAWVREYQA